MMVPGRRRSGGLRVFPAERVDAPGETDQQLVVTAELEDGSIRDVTRQAAYDLSDPTRFEVTADGLVHARGPGEAVIAVRYRNGRATSRLAFPADRPGFAWRGGEARASGRSGRLCQAPGDADQSLAPGRGSRLPPPGLSRRDRPAPRPRRDARLPRRSRPREAEQAGRPPGRSPRVRRLLGPEVGRPAPQRGEDHGREGRLAPPALAARRARPRRPARHPGPPARGRPGLDLAESPRELLPDQPRADDRRGERRAGVPRHPHPVRPLPQPSVRRLDPGRLLRAVGLLLQHRPQGARQRPQGRPRQARDQRR